MTSFTFSAEQISSAPPEARRWMENEIAKALACRPPNTIRQGCRQARLPRARSMRQRRYSI